MPSALASTRVVGMRLDVLLEILGSLEGLLALGTSVRLERDMDAQVRGDVVALDDGRVALLPAACEVQVVVRLATDVDLSQVGVELFWSSKLLAAHWV